MSRLVVVLPLSPLREGDRFAVHEWPLHVTVLPPFKTDATGAEIADAIRSATAGNSALRMVAAGGELFGRHYDMLVTLLAEKEQLIALRRTLRAAGLPLAAEP